MNSPIPSLMLIVLHTGKFTGKITAHAVVYQMDTFFMLYVRPLLAQSLMFEQSIEDSIPEAK